MQAEKPWDAGKRAAFVFFMLVAALTIYTLFIRAMPANHAPALSELEVKPQLVTDGLISPVVFAAPNDGSNRIFIGEQRGTIKVVQGGKLQEQVFLNVSGKLVKINDAYDERGLLGLAFHPRFRDNGRFFVYYSAPADNGSNHKSVISEFKVSSGQNQAAEQEHVIMTIDQPQGNHNGGHLDFGPDGFLYIGVGDGGGQGDKHGDIGNGQNLNTLLGKILRIDVDGKEPYAIPGDNPFQGSNQRPEIFAYGFRNPWRFSFDKANGQLYVGDVGQNMYEEVSLVKKGDNCGWRLMEGYHCYNPKENCKTPGLVQPIAEYDHNVGISVCGGYVYRGKEYKQVQGRYIFADWNGKFFSTVKAGKNWQLSQLKQPQQTDFNLNDMRINTMGEDPSGEIYVVAQKMVGTLTKPGYLYKLTWN